RSISLERSTDSVLAMMAVLKTGAAFLPLEVRQSAHRTLAIVEAAKPDLVIGCDRACPFCPAAIRQLTLPALMDGETPVLTEQALTPPHITIHSDSTAYLLFSSGSTGVPKGVGVRRTSGSKAQTPRLIEKLHFSQISGRNHYSLTQLSVVPTLQNICAIDNGNNYHYHKYPSRYDPRHPRAHGEPRDQSAGHQSNA
ncbi:MAG: AMP-binding protein, partial [Exilibacterium sp.]